MVSSPRPAWAFFVILLLFHLFARTFFQPVPLILWHWAVSMPLLAPNAHFLPDAKTPLPCVVFMRWLSLFLHPDGAVANLSRPILSRMARNNSRGTATSAIWKTIFPEWRTTFAPILISFSRNVVNVQCRTACGSTAWRRKLPRL